MSKDDFDKVPIVRHGACFDFTSLVVIPLNELRDNGFSYMMFVAADKDGNPICAFGGCQDVIHVNGLMGIGDKHIDDVKDKATGRLLIDPIAWRIDCLPCGYLRIFAKNMNSEKRSENLTAQETDCSDLDVLCS